MIGALRHLAIMLRLASVRNFLCAFSIMTIAASTMAPMAMAMPESDMMLASTPWTRMTRKAAMTPSGKVTMATSAERR